MFCDGDIYTKLVMGAGRPTNGRSRVETTVEHGKNLLFPFFTGLNNNLKELLRIKRCFVLIKGLDGKVKMLNFMTVP